MECIIKMGMKNPEVSDRRWILRGHRENMTTSRIAAYGCYSDSSL